jgi:hypothetical protein
VTPLWRRREDFGVFAVVSDGQHRRLSSPLTAPDRSKLPGRQPASRSQTWMNSRMSSRSSSTLPGARLHPRYTVRASGLHRDQIR